MHVQFFKEECLKCAHYDESDFPNLFCNKIDDFINGAYVEELEKAGCQKAKEWLQNNPPQVVRRFKLMTDCGKII